MNERIIPSKVDFGTGILMWKTGQNEAEQSTWMLLLTEKTVHSYIITRKLAACSVSQCS